MNVLKNNHFYQVAGHKFHLSFSEGIFMKEVLSNYAPFLLSEGADNCLFRLSVVKKMPDLKKYHLVGQFDDDIASIRISKSLDGEFRFQYARPGSENYSIMDIDATFQTAQLQLPMDENDRYYYLNNSLMLLFAFSSARLDTLMIHASVIKKGDKGFIFLGKSGTGKSTHSRLWLEHIEGSELLNDDNPVVRIVNGTPMVYGSPWSGKTPCYRNVDVGLKGIVKLRQASKNQIKKLSFLQAYAALLPACSSMRWEDEISSGVHRTIEKLTVLVPCYRLDCLPDKAAAQLCAATIMGKR